MHLYIYKRISNMEPEVFPISDWIFFFLKDMQTHIHVRQLGDEPKSKH